MEKRRLTERVADVSAGVLDLLADLPGRTAHALALALGLQVGVAGRVPTSCLARPG